MNLRGMPVGLLLLTLFALTAIGIAILIWLSLVPDGELNDAQSKLIEIADWLVKVSVGAILGIRGSAQLKTRNGIGAQE